MTEETIRNLKTLLCTQYNEIRVLSVEEVDNAISELEQELYEREIKAFAQHINDSFPTDDPTDAKLEKFDNENWVIMFAGKSALIKNCATIYNAMVDLFDEYIKEDL